MPRDLIRRSRQWAPEKRTFPFTQFKDLPMTMNAQDKTPLLALARCCRGFRGWVAVLALGMAAGMAQAEARATEVAPGNSVGLSASGFLEVPQDWLTVRMSVSREGADAAEVQSQLRQALDSGMGVARGAAAPNQQMTVRNGAFGVFPRYDKSGKISGWQGNAELLLEGRDFTRIANTAGKIQTLTISDMAFSLSRETQQKLESDVQALAIERFKRRAAEVAKGFGFGGFQLREINVSSADEGGNMPVRSRAMAMESKSFSAASREVAMEPGTSRVTVTVSGTVGLK
jgi:predicted secreted protein